MKKKIKRPKVIYFLLKSKSTKSKNCYLPKGEYALYEFCKSKKSKKRKKKKPTTFWKRFFFIIKLLLKL